jgi:hypothetical protein
VILYITPNTSSSSGGGGGGGGIVVMTGAIGDYGKTTGQTNKNGNADKSGSYGNIELQKGTIRVNLTALDAKTKNLGSQTRINPAGCFDGAIGYRTDHVREWYWPLQGDLRHRKSHGDGGVHPPSLYEWKEQGKMQRK